MMIMDARLSICADFISGKGVVCDVGTDHAYLPVYLVLNKKCPEAIACDINEGPLNAARQTVERYEVSDRVRLIKSDGLLQVPLSGVTDVVIAGMGAELICEIIAKSAALKDEINLILQPMTHVPILRRWLYANGFEILEERPAQEDRFIYTIMQVHYTGTIVEIDAVTQNIGKMDLSCELSKRYAQKQIIRLEKAGLGIQKGAGTSGMNEFLLTAQEIRRLLEGFH